MTLSSVQNVRLTPENYQELRRLVEIWEGGDGPEWLGVAYFGAHPHRYFITLNHVSPDRPGTMIYIGTAKECIAYLKGAIHGKRNMVNI